MRKIKHICLALILFACLFLPTENVRAETLQDYQNLLNKYKNEVAKYQNEINEAERKIEANKDQIESIKKEVQQMNADIDKMSQEIVDYNNTIKEKSLETKQLFEYLQVARGENLYLEYAFDADTLTDLIYRVSVVQQLTEYNDNLVKSLEEMINNNEKRSKDLAKKQEEYGQRQIELTAQITRLTGMQASLNENSVSSSQQVKIYQDLVNSFKALGCQPKDVIGVDCAQNNNVAGWYRPIDKGYVTSEFGYRWGSLHRAIDVSNGNPYNTKIYPVASGRISSIYHDSYGALTLTIEHKTANGKYYSSLYTHLSKYAPGLYVGKQVGVNDYIGYMGDSGYAMGPHLHLEIAPCRIFNPSDSNCGSWNKYTAYVKKIYSNGSFKGPRDLIYFPKLRVNFTGR